MSTITLKSGRSISAYRSVLGLDITGERRDLHDGWDGTVDFADSASEESTPLTPDERRELADRMIARWNEWAIQGQPPTAFEPGISLDAKQDGIWLTVRGTTKAACICIPEANGRLVNEAFAQYLEIKKQRAA